MREPLTVRVASFSYKSPPDFSSSPHGGGFVFDCRCLPNPGRDPAFAPLTGLDDSVREMLEAQAAVERYRSLCRDLVNDAIANYRERDFQMLSVFFGCTGGRHRSVYLTDWLAARIREEHPDVRAAVQHMGLAGAT